MLKTFDVLLDIEKELHHISMPAFNISQSDLDSVEITFHVNQDDAAFDLTDKTVQIAIKKPSGLTIFQNCSIVDAAAGETNVILSKQAYIEYGFYTGELMISDLDQMIVTTPFYYGVRTAIMAAQAEESINDWSALENALFNMDKKPLIVDGVPTAVPEYTGQMAVDTTGKRAFIAYDTTATGWQLIAAGEGGAGGGIVYWNDILGKPLTFAPAAHGHVIGEISGLQAALDAKADIGETGGGAVAWEDVTGKPLTFAPAAHTHAIGEVTGLQGALDGKADNADLAAYAPVNHVHDFADIANKPLTYTPTAHTHAIADVGGLQAALDGKADDTDLAAKADLGHTHTTANITDFAAGVAAAIPAEYLTAAEGDAAYQPIGNYLTDIPPEYLTQTEGDARYAIKGATEGTTAVSWGDIAGTLANQTDLQAALDAKADDGDLAAKADLGHTHAIGDVTGLQAALDGKANDADLAGKADVGHTHTVANITDFAAGVAANIPAEYLTETEGDTRYMAAGAAPTAHTHTAAEITDFAAAVGANIPVEYLTATEGDAAYQPKGDYLTALPDHTHAIADVTGLQAALDGKADDADLAAKADLGHTHTAANITDFGTAVAAAIPAEYLTATEGDAAYMPAGAAPTAHTHTTADITDFAAGVAANIPAEYLTETEGNAVYAKTANVYSKTAVDTALAGKSDTGHTHTTANITDFAAGVAANIPAAYMTDTETAAAYQPKGTYLTAVPLASTAAVGGGRVGNGLGMSGEYLYVKTGAGLGINTVDYSLQVQTTRATPTAVKFWTGNATEYAAVTKDANTLYFITG